MKSLQTLVLARLAGAREGLTRSELGSSLEPVAARQFDAEGWRTTLDAVLAQAEAPGLVLREGRGRWRLTEAGRALLATELGPFDPDQVGWPELADRMATRALGLTDPAVVHSAQALRLSLAAREHGITFEERPTEARLLDALTWKALGVHTHRPVTKEALQLHLLGKLLGVESLASSDEVIAMVAARSVGAKDASARELRAAALQKYVFEGTPEAPAQAASSSGPSFIDQVLLAARATPFGARFGFEKVYISDVWRAIREAAIEPGLGENDFKQRLLQAHREGTVTLVHADLVEMMDPVKLAASELPGDQTTFHFLHL